MLTYTVAAMKWVRRSVLVLLAIVVLAVGIRLALPAIGGFHVRNDRLEKADIIVVLAGNRIERALEAGMLYREGWSGRIFLTRAPDVATSSLLRGMNVQVPMLVHVQRDVLRQMGVPESAVTFSDRVISTTREESALVADYARQIGAKRIIVVTSPYHTGRAGRYLRSTSGDAFQVIMHPTRFEPFDTKQWWRRPGDRLQVVIESIKFAHGLIPGVAALSSR